MKIASYLLLAAAIVSTGCEPNQNVSVTADKDAPAAISEDAGTKPAEDAAAAASKVELTLADWDTIAADIASSKVPVVVDIWSTQCVPCMQEFHGLVELQNEFGDRLRCISVNIDYVGLKSMPPESSRDDVLAFLESQKASLTNYLSTTADSEVYEKLELSSIPAVFVYNADGSLNKRFVDEADGGVSYEKDIHPFVKQLVGE